MLPDQEPKLINGLYRVDLDGKTLNDLKEGGFHIYYFGDCAEATEHENGLLGIVGVYQEGTLARSYREPWYIQLEMIAEENAKLQRIDSSWRIIAPPNAATVIEVAQKVNRQHGFNVLPWYTRVGNGSLVAGNFRPRDSADVRDSWHPDGRDSYIGVLPLAVKA